MKFAEVWVNFGMPDKSQTKKPGEFPAANPLARSGVLMAVVGPSPERGEGKRKNKKENISRANSIVSANVALPLIDGAFPLPLAFQWFRFGVRAALWVFFSRGVFLARAAAAKKRLFALPKAQTCDNRVECEIEKYIDNLMINYLQKQHVALSEL